jgi:2-dehydro-3-deoxyphosphogluconate aldolase / (4S)-4-hydroxy-2-oxoglutarate aldolase
MQAGQIFSRLGALRVIPVITIEDSKTALLLADALLDGGLPIAEITFRTPAAVQAIQIMANERPGLLIGAGTVLTSDDLQAAKAAGARFCVAPGLNPEMVKQAQDVNLPFIPGVATPSEIEQALSLGCTTLKFFPAEALGGIEMLNSLSGPYAHKGLKFIPTGGVTPSNMEDYLACMAVIAVGGTWIAKRQDVMQGKWQEIQDRCEEAVQIVGRIKCSTRLQRD